MPPEWAPHARCWMAWPCREDLWGDRLSAVREAYAEVAKEISRFEPVTMIANPHDVAEASLSCGSGVSCLSLTHDDSWARDSGADLRRRSARWGGRYRLGLQRLGRQVSALRRGTPRWPVGSWSSSSCLATPRPW